MPVFFLVRHGENDYVKEARLAGRKPGVHLNEKGRAQAQGLAEKLSKLPIKAVYSSPLERALETAEPIAEAIKLEVTIREGLLETNYGQWQNKTLKSLRRRKLWKVVQSSPSLMHFPEGETFADTQHRISQEIEALRVKHRPKDLVVCVSHADPIKLVVAYYIGLPLDNFQRLMVGPASVTALHLSDTSAHLVNLNVDLTFSLPHG
jgi:probable phosphoglycerate mutase